jgi:hypothetical protein
VPWPTPERGSAAATVDTATIAIARVIVEDMATPVFSFWIFAPLHRLLTADVQSRATI